MKNPEKYAYLKIPSKTFLDELLGKLIQGRATDEEKGLLAHWDAMVTEGVDMGVIARHRDLHNFKNWAEDVQKVLLNSANDGARHEWMRQYDAEEAEAREKHGVNR